MSEHDELDTKVAVIIQHPAGSDAYEMAEEIIALVRADERKRIREAMFSNEGVNVVARDLWAEAVAEDPRPVLWDEAVQTCHPCVHDYQHSALVTITAFGVAIGLIEEGEAQS